MTIITYTTHMYYIGPGSKTHILKYVLWSITQWIFHWEIYRTLPECNALVGNDKAWLHGRYQKYWYATGNIYLSLDVYLLFDVGYAVHTIFNCMVWETTKLIRHVWRGWGRAITPLWWPIRTIQVSFYFKHWLLKLASCC